MQKRFYQILALALFMIPTISSAQEAAIEDVETTLHKTTKRADEYFDAKEYSVAVEAYSKAYSKEKSRDQKQRISYNMAECYRFTGQCKRAASYYLRAQKLGRVLRIITRKAPVVRFVFLPFCSFWASDI